MKAILIFSPFFPEVAMNHICPQTVLYGWFNHFSVKVYLFCQAAYNTLILSNHILRAILFFYSYHIFTIGGEQCLLKL